ncbi:MAG: response regulator [Leptolyngbyaceae cyanobacterium bins.302]|nr:response regulator [Leptolyngbyaceae cyanobacterium bins.302]
MNRPSSETASTTFRILVVDDIPDNYVLLQTILESEGYQVETADNGKVALEKVAANPPDLVLLDVMMPDMDGFEVAQAIRQNTAFPSIPILLVTGYGEPDLTNSSEFNGFIYKPIDFDQLLSQIQAILQSRN